jgi:hypothetical protein
VTQTPCNYNRDYAYANGFPVIVKGLDMDIPVTSATNGNMSFGVGVEFGCWMDVWGTDHLVSSISSVGFELRVARSLQLKV